MRARRTRPSIPGRQRADGAVPDECDAGFGRLPRTVIRVEDRDAYLGALDRASIDMGINPFCAFLGQRVQWSLELRFQRGQDENSKRKEQK